MCTVTCVANVVYCFSSARFTTDVTFPEFIRYLLLKSKHKTKGNLYWRPQYDVCQPCHIKYDAVIYYETMDEDAKHVLREIDAGPHVKLPPRSIDTTKSASDKYMSLYDNVPIRDIRCLLSLFKKDFVTYGYEIPSNIRHRLDALDIGNKNISKK